MATTSALGETAASLSANYMSLLVEQLRHQDPLEPTDNAQMTAQLTQLSSLEQLESMNGTFKQVLAAQQKLQAAELINKQVSWQGADSMVASGKVDAVQVTRDGVSLKVGQNTVNLDDVLGIRN
jgi:flagellar basal-body rod modification protein FlgD